MTMKTMSRRSVLQTTSVGAALTCSPWVARDVMAKGTAVFQSEDVPVALRGGVAAVAVVQGKRPNEEETFQQTEDRVVKRIREINDALNKVDLIVIGDYGGVRPEGLFAVVAAAQRFGCHVVLCSSAEGQSALVSTDGRVHTANPGQHLIVKTRIGTLAVVSGLQSADSVAEFASVDILIRNESAGYQQGDVQAASAYNKQYAVVVTPTQLECCKTDAATAVYGPFGEIMTRVSPLWDQAVFAVLPIAKLRALRTAHVQS